MISILVSFANRLEQTSTEQREIVSFRFALRNETWKHFGLVPVETDGGKIQMTRWLRRCCFVKRPTFIKEEAKSGDSLI